MKKSNQPLILVHERSKYRDIYQKRPRRLRVYETLLYLLVMVVLSAFIPVESTLYKVMAVVVGFLIIGGAPAVYRRLLNPEYTLTSRELIIRIRGQERNYPLSKVERVSPWRALFLLDGKKEPLMVSNHFLNQLDNQLAKAHKQMRR